MDEDFYHSIHEFMNGFANMYPMIEFHYENVIVSEQIVDTKEYSINNEEDNALLYFSGGVDAYTSLIRHEDEKLILLTVCGADTWYSNKIGFSEIIKKNQEIANLHNLRIVSCVSTLRKFINEKEIYDYVEPLVNDNFWHGFQHGLGMFGLSAGYVYLYNLKKIYFASSFCDKDENVRCGSDPSIDNYVRIGSSKVCHDGFELSRQDKVASLCKYSKDKNKKLNLRVCYRSAVGDNCCECEKCVRTMMAILVEGYDPKEFGFERFDQQKVFTYLIMALKKLSEAPDIAYALYGEIISKLKKIYTYDECPNEIKILYHAGFTDVMFLLNSIRLQEKIEKNSSVSTLPYVKTSEMLYKQFLRADQKQYRELCEYLYQKSELCPPQKVDYWIGNKGFALNGNEYVDVTGRNLIIHSRNSKVVFEGWAADFVNGTPLAELFVIIDDNYYNLNYGLENKNLAKRFQNELLCEIAFKAEIPIDALKRINQKEIAFCMIGYQGGKIIRYPEIKYIVVIDQR